MPNRALLTLWSYKITEIRKLDITGHDLDIRPLLKLETSEAWILNKKGCCDIFAPHINIVEIVLLHQFYHQIYL